MVHLLIKTTSDGYEDRSSWIVGAYSNENVANEEKITLENARKLLEQQIEEANEREGKFWNDWDDSLREAYVAKGLSKDELTTKYYELEKEARGNVQDYLWDDIVWYKVISVEVDSDEFERKIL